MITIPSLLIVAILAATTSSQKPLTLAEAVAAAMANFPGVAAAADDARAARDTVREAEAARMPAINLGASATRFSDPMLATPIHAFDLRNPPAFEETLVQSAVTASYPLYDAGARHSRIDESRHNAESAEAATERARQDAGARAAAAYATALGRAAVADAQRLRIEALEAERERVRQFLAVGRAAHVDALRVDAALAAAAAERADAEASLDAAERTLARITALPLETTRAGNLVALDENALPFPDRAVLETLTAETPLVRQARARELAQQAAIGQARSGRLPQLTAAAQELFFAAPRALLAAEWNVGVQLHLSVFDGGAAKARIARATDLAHAAGEQVRTARIETGIALDRTLAELRQSRDAIATLASAIGKFDEVTRIEKLRLENGAGTQADYLRAEADLLAARANLAAAGYRAIAARVELARITGQLQTDWVETTFGAAK